MANIVLAHGFLGAGALPVLDQGLYFRGIAELYRDLHHTVIEPSVSRTGSLATRSKELQSKIEAAWPDGREFAIIAHSMGGLDARRIMNQRDDANQYTPFARRVNTLITIATPHYGSAVADAALKPGANVPDWLSALTGALRDLQTRSTLQDDDRPGARYVRIACDCAGMEPAQLSPIFTASRTLAGWPVAGNDGMVTVDSQSASKPGALREPDETWRVDHGGAIGWPSGVADIAANFAFWRRPADHLARYEHLLSYLR